MLATSLVVACTEDKSETEAPVYTGKSTVVEVDTEAGDYNFKITTTGEWKAAAANSVSRNWIDITGADHGVGDATLTLHYHANSGFAREGRIAVKLLDAAVVDTIVIRQKGMTPHLSFRDEVVSVYPVGGKVSAEIDTNLTGSLLERITVSSAPAPDGTAVAEWISSPELVVGTTLVNFTCERYIRENGSPREGYIKLSFVDDLGEQHSTLCKVSQSPMSEPKELTFAQMRAMATTAGVTVTDNYTIDGVVVSDRTSENVAGNKQTAATTIDFTTNARTVYVQDLDAQSGVMLELNSIDDNIFERWSRVTLTLSNTTLTRYDNPERYVISNVSANAMLGYAAGEPVVNEKYMKDVTTANLYTYVTLKDCEFPVREGSYANVNEGYTQTFGANNLDKYPLSVVDTNGGSCYLFTNIAAPWRRDGKTLPLGTGNLSGVVVYETFPQFDYTDKYAEKGWIGDWQIRPITQDDIAIHVTNRKSTIIAEWSTMAANMIVDGKLKPSYGTGELYHEAGALVSTSSKNCITEDFSALGPYDGTEGSSDRGQNAGNAVRNYPCWDSTNNCGLGWVVAVSTRGITAKNVVLALGMLNQALGAPRFWAVEWSEHGQKDGTWHRVANSEFTVPDIAAWANRRLYSLAGDKNLTVNLPLEILGKDTVYIRLIPTENNAGKSGYADYVGGTVGNNWNRISYLSIQYNN